MYKYLYDPDLNYRNQMRSGRMRLMSQSFDSLEKEIRQELNRIFGSWGFRDSRDISGIINVGDVTATIPDQGLCQAGKRKHA